jgi:Xaa-Pro aminopeptidase
MKHLSRIAQLARDANLDGWLLYDFRGNNPFANQLLELGQQFLSRRWFLYVPAAADQPPTLINHRIEAGTWADLTKEVKLERIAYSSHEELDAALARVLRGQRRIAMEYSPRAAVPYVSTVDAGTIERVREHGVEVVSSGDLLQLFLVWNQTDLEMYKKAALGVVRAKDEAFRFLHERFKAKERVTELEVQDVIMACFEEDGLKTDHPANVSFGSHAGDPHYTITDWTNRKLEVGMGVLIDLWAGVPGYPMCDIAWVGFAGKPTEDFMNVWHIVAQARDAAITMLLQQSNLQGWMVDKAARDVIQSAGYGFAFTHRLGHSLGRDAPHGDTANLDNLETHDTRTLLPNTAVTVEPGIYLDHLGIRSEVNVLIQQHGAVVTTPIQREPYILGLESLMGG